MEEEEPGNKGNHGRRVCTDSGRCSSFPAELSQLDRFMVCEVEGESVIGDGARAFLPFCEDERRTSARKAYRRLGPIAISIPCIVLSG